MYRPCLDVCFLCSSKARCSAHSVLLNATALFDNAKSIVRGQTIQIIFIDIYPEHNHVLEIQGMYIY